jgi:hypothetical protein
MTFGIRSGLTRAEMRGRDTGCRRTVISYVHRRKNVAIQQAGAPEIAYRDAAAIDITHVNLVSQHRGTQNMMDLRNHRSIATRANTDNSAG